MVAFRFEFATMEDAILISGRARKADVDELAVLGATPFDCMRYGLANSLQAWTVFAGSTPVCMFGVSVTGLLTSEGAPWMVGTKAIDQHAKVFLLESKLVLQAVLAEWSHLQNWVDARNVRAIRWLQFIGFTIHPAEPYGEQNFPFHRFEMRSGHVQ